MGHCGEFCYAQWATAANLVERYGHFAGFGYMLLGHCGLFGYELWATAWNEGVQ
jgi:hypothetical protein